MAVSKCIRCDNTSFEFKEAEPAGAEYKVYFIQCSNCGGVVGVMDFFDTSELIFRLAEGLNVSLER